jgi:hypothetical protein
MYARVCHLFCPLLMVSEEFVSPFSFCLYTLNQADTGNNMEKGGKQHIGTVARGHRALQIQFN